VGHAQRLERWLRPPNLVAGIQPVAPVVNNVGGAAVVDDEVEGAVEFEMGVVEVYDVAAGLVEMISGRGCWFSVEPALSDFPYRNSTRVRKRTSVCNNCRRNEV